MVFQRPLVFQCLLSLFIFLLLHCFSIPSLFDPSIHLKTDVYMKCGDYDTMQKTCTGSSQLWVYHCEGGIEQNTSPLTYLQILPPGKRKINFPQ